MIGPTIMEDTATDVYAPRTAPLFSSVEMLKK